MQCAVCSVQCAVCSLQCAACSVQCEVYRRQPPGNVEDLKEMPVEWQQLTEIHKDAMFVTLCFDIKFLTSKLIISEHSLLPNNCLGESLNRKL